MLHLKLTKCMHTVLVWFATVFLQLNTPYPHVLRILTPSGCLWGRKGMGEGQGKKNCITQRPQSRYTRKSWAYTYHTGTLKGFILCDTSSARLHFILIEKVFKNVLWVTTWRITLCNELTKDLLPKSTLNHELMCGLNH